MRSVTFYIDHLQPILVIVPNKPIMGMVYYWIYHMVWNHKPVHVSSIIAHSIPMFIIFIAKSACAISIKSLCDKKMSQLYHSTIFPPNPSSSVVRGKPNRKTESWAKKKRDNHPAANTNCITFLAADLPVWRRSKNLLITCKNAIRANRWGFRWRFSQNQSIARPTKMLIYARWCPSSYKWIIIPSTSSIYHHHSEIGLIGTNWTLT